MVTWGKPATPGAVASARSSSPRHPRTSAGQGWKKATACGGPSGRNRGAKHTAALIPLCHPLPLDLVSVEIRLDADPLALIFVEARTRAPRSGDGGPDRSVRAGLALIDMVKGVDRSPLSCAARAERRRPERTVTRDGFEDPVMTAGSPRKVTRGSGPRCWCVGPCLPGTHET